MANLSWIADDLVYEIEQKKYKISLQFILVVSLVGNSMIFSYLV
jgi:hypothetical protein